MSTSCQGSRLTRRFVVTAMASSLAGAGTIGLAQSNETELHRHGAGGMMRHDEVTMPGLRGLDATVEESNEIAVLFRYFRMIERDVERLQNGIRTRTYSNDPELMAVIVSHVTGMLNRIEEGRDPQIFIQSQTLDILFERNATMINEIEVSDDGIWVTQISDDTEVVAALQTHADEVTDMVERGMMAVHEKMMQRSNANG